MKKHIFLLIVLCCIVAGCFLGCVSESKGDNAESESVQNEVDYSTYNFAGVQWIRDTECDETLCFRPNGEFRTFFVEGTKSENEENIGAAKNVIEAFLCYEDSVVIEVNGNSQRFMI